MDPEPGYQLLTLSDNDLIIGFIAIFVLLSFSALVSAAEVAYFSLTQKDIEQCVQENPASANIVSRLLEKPKKLLATLVVANNFINICVVILFSVIGQNLFASIASPALKFVAEVAIVTFFILLFGEVLPKIYASRNNIKFYLFISTWIKHTFFNKSAIDKF